MRLCAAFGLASCGRRRGQAGARIARAGLAQREEMFRQKH